MGKDFAIDNSKRGVWSNFNFMVISRTFFGEYHFYWNDENKLAGSRDIYWISAQFLVYGEQLVQFCSWGQRLCY